MSEPEIDIVAPEEDFALYKMKHSGSIAGRQNCDRILLQFLDMEDVRSTTALDEEDTEFVSSLTVFNDSYMS
jgi:hypothetical protein